MKIKEFDKKRTAIEVYNAVTNYYIKLLNFTSSNISSIMTEKEILGTMIAIMAIEVMFKKEELVIKKENVKVVDNTSNTLLDDLLLVTDSINDGKVKPLIGTGCEFFAYIRHKLAHGDFTLSEDFKYIVLKKEIDPVTEEYQKIYINTEYLFRNIFAIASNYNCFLKTNKYVKNVIIDKAPDIIKLPIDTPEKLNNYMKLLRVKTFELSRVDGGDLSYEEQNDFNRNVMQINSKVDGKSLKTAFILLREKYMKLGYIVNITTKNLNNVMDKEKVERIINVVNNRFSADAILDENYRSAIIYEYGEGINKSLVADTCNFPFLIHSNVLINLLSNNVLSYKSSINYIDGIISNHDRVYVYLALARIYALYSLPFDYIYKNGKRYHLNRIGELDFGELNLDYIHVDYININDSFITNAENGLLSASKDLTSIINTIAAYDKNINGMKSISKPTQKILDKINEFEYKKELLEDKLSLLYDNYIDKQLYLDAVTNDYNDNYKYYYNRKVIESIRNSIAHGNVTFDKIGEVTNFNNVVINFSDYDKGELVFKCHMTVYELEYLFSRENIDVISSIHENNKEKILN